MSILFKQTFAYVLGLLSLIFLINIPLTSYTAENKNEKSPKEEVQTPKPILPKEWNGKFVDLPVLPGKPYFRFEIEKFQISIKVYRHGESEPFQVLYPKLTEGAPKGKSGLSVIDFDGDGDFDLQIIDWWGVTGNIGYQIYLYDQAKNLFVHSPMYSQLSRPQPDGTGCVTSGGVAGHAGQIYSRGYYCPQGEKLFPVWEERQDWNHEGEFYVFTRKEFNKDQRLIRDTMEHRKYIDSKSDWLVTWFGKSVWDDKTKCYEKTIKILKNEKLVEINKESYCEIKKLNGR